jgi:hypothetical protein
VRFFAAEMPSSVSLMFFVCKKGFVCFLEVHRRFVEAILEIIVNQRLDSYARLPAARAVISTFPSSVGALLDLVIPFFERAVAFAVELAEIAPECDDFKFVKDYIDDPECGLYATLGESAPSGQLFDLALSLLQGRFS